MQALLFGRPELTLFETAEARRETVAYLEGMIDLAARLGAGAMVFGSPKNRRVAGRPAGEVEAIARDVFGGLGDYAHPRGVWFCIEANPAAYGCDFVTTTVEADALVSRVGRPGFGLHLDLGGMALNGEPIAETLGGCARRARHFHVSEPFLEPVGSADLDHAAAAAALGRSGYAGWVSVEMKEPPPDRPWAAVLEASLGHVARVYRGVAA
jgi:sugar phosphate isomerase/epimerase